MKKTIILVLILAIILGFLFWKFSPSLPFFKQQKAVQQITLTYWGLWEDENLIKPVILEYQKQNPNITISYVKQSSINYRTRVQTQIREGKGVGPDVFRIHNSWLPMFISDISSAPSDVFNLNEFRDLFYPVAQSSLVKDNQIFAAPMEIDGLALFVNEELINGAGGKTPSNWQEFIDLGNKMTVKDSSGIKTAGAAIGSTGNVDHWSDILGLLLFQQPGVNFNNLATAQVAEVINFYTGFVTDPKRKTWDTNLPPSTQMFVTGRLGFYFAPSWRAHELRVANPNLKFKVASIPQLSDERSAYASFWAETVSKNSNNPLESWKFVKFLTSSQAQRLAYQQASQVRLFGEPYSLKSLASELAKDPIVGAFVSQGPIYKSWYLSSNTFDVGINDGIIKYFEDGINTVLAGTDPLTALGTVDKGVQEVLDKFTKPQPSPTPR